jgi:PEP-CTERM motif
VFQKAFAHLNQRIEHIRRNMLKLIRSAGKMPVPVLAAMSLALIGSLAASADAVSDAPSDFLPTFNGPHNGDLDVLSTNVTLNGTNFDFTATLNGPVGETPGAVYVFGLDRGKGTPKFANIGHGGVIFDSTFVITNIGGGTVNDLISQTKTTISDVTFSGATINAVVPVSDLPSQGFSANQYTFNLWPESGAANAANTEISDFAPDNSMAPVSAAAAPEPSTMALLGLAGVAVGLLRLRKRSVKTAMPLSLNQ